MILLAFIFIGIDVIFLGCLFQNPKFLNQFLIALCLPIVLFIIGCLWAFIDGCIQSMKLIKESKEDNNV